METVDSTSTKRKYLSPVSTQGKIMSKKLKIDD